MVALRINGKNVNLNIDPGTPLLWALRDHVGLTGTKFGCGVSDCGACTVLIDGVATRSCTTEVSEAEGSDIVTIEGLSTNGELHPVQKAWLDEQVPQCGYCQSAQILTAVALLKENPHPTPQQIDDGMSDVLCRCGTYCFIRKAVARAAGGGQ